ncbi:putative hydrolase [Georgenia satyanarayanai]|uniref:Putative hydrolase n=1 Tax=Georgenia satyanarayanai TaxID=860221 RepID=A0A2Y9C2V9_9MICO|nr:PHP domain-containing protein [Georgenia satyanarayanai]PYG01960.1 putative hydrolase [Georgenia satyanarayanai]SSA36763.1 putative hydrolase [Georgenia satyanarayanai]
MDPVAALKRVAYLMERERAEARRATAFRKAARRLEGLGPRELERRLATGTLTELADVGQRTAGVAMEAAGGQVPDYLADLEERAGVPLAEGGDEVRGWLRGDLHSHSEWSDGGTPIIDMARAAIDLGHDYLALTDHSPRLTVARGLSPERLREQLDAVERLNAELAPFRILTGIEVDILDDGGLDQEPELLARLDVVVASVHSKLRMDAASMTRRMVAAVEHPLVDVLGHCTGRLVTGGRGTRPESQFDAEAVFGACLDNDVAVELNSRPERLDPPTRLLELVVDLGCRVAIDTDAHAPGQLEFLDHGCARAQDAGVPRERIVNALPLDDLLAWTNR